MHAGRRQLRACLRSLRHFQDSAVEERTWKTQGKCSDRSLLSRFSLFVLSCIVILSRDSRVCVIMLQSLCNACGIRFKKAGRRSAANGPADSEVLPPATTEVAKRSLDSDEPQFWVFPADAKPRKRSRGSVVHRTSESLLAGSCMTWQPWSSPRNAFRASPPSHSDDGKVPVMESGSFFSDEEKGAVLLMQLSCGVVNA